MLTPFTHGLSLAWADGGLSKAGFHALDRLQAALALSDDARAREEAAFEANLASPESAGIGAGATLTLAFAEACERLSSGDLRAHAHAMAATALRAGLTREGWQAGLVWFEGWGCGDAWAEGCWHEGEGANAQPLDSVPEAAAPLADTLALI